MDTPDPTRANSALWTRYFEQRLGANSPVASWLGMGIANLYAQVGGDVIDDLFAANAPKVTSFVRQSRAERVEMASTQEEALSPGSQPSAAAATTPRERVAIPV
jgi:hypothetical protein